MLGLRYAFHRPLIRPLLVDGRIDWLWPLAEHAGVPIMLFAAQTDLHIIDGIAERHPALKLTIDHFALTNFLRRHASLDERVEMVRTMWRIVYSDRKLTDYEHYLVRKLSDLLGLEHHVMIDAKVSVLKEMGLAVS